MVTSAHIIQHWVELFLLIITNSIKCIVVLFHSHTYQPSRESLDIQGFDL